LSETSIKELPLLTEMVTRLRDAADARLLSVILYGPAAHGDYRPGITKLHLMVVLQELDLATLAAVGVPVRWWLKRPHPMPRFFSPAHIEESADVFPIEFLDMRAHNILLCGRDLLADLVVQRDHLRLQCEREMREKMMRLCEAYIESEGRERMLRRLIASSYPTFTRIFRGCLFLSRNQVPQKAADVVAAFCELTGVEVRPFEAAARVAGGHRVDKMEELFQSYYAALNQSVRAVDSFQSKTEGLP
jgi:hypothetical protein